MSQLEDQKEIEEFELHVPNLIGAVASEHLDQILQNKKASEQRVIDALNALKDELLTLRKELARERANSNGLRKQINDLKTQNDLHLQRNRSLFNGFNALLKVIDNSDVDVSIEQKFEAMLLSSDFAVYLGVEPNVCTRNAVDFLKTIPLLDQKG